MPDDRRFKSGETVTEYALGMALAWLGVCVSPRGRTGEAVEFSLRVLKEVLTEDLAKDGPDRGAICRGLPYRIR